MSGGYFEYKQRYIEDIARDIESYLKNGGPFESEDTKDAFVFAVYILRLAAIYAERIDHLIEGDDSEYTFHERLQEDKSRLNNGEGTGDE